MQFFVEQDCPHIVGCPLSLELWINPITFSKQLNIQKPSTGSPKAPEEAPLSPVRIPEERALPTLKFKGSVSLLYPQT